MTTPQPTDLFLQVFAHRLNFWEDGELSAMQSLDWGTVWVECCRIAKRIEGAQTLADSAKAVAPTTPADWVP